MNSKEQFLLQVEHYLNDIPIETRVNLLSNTISEIEGNPAVMREEPLSFINKMRARHNLTAFREKKRNGCLSILFKFMIFICVTSALVVGILWYKFTPLFRIDEENQKVTILGGVIDLDGRSGKVKIFDEVQFSPKNNFDDSFDMSVNLDERLDEIRLKFDSGKLTLKTAMDNQLQLKCKISKPFDSKMINQTDTLLAIDFSKLEGITCEIEIPEDKNFVLEGQDTAVNVIAPLFNLYMDAQNGHIAISPMQEHDYLYDLQVKQGYVGKFKSSKSASATEIQVNLKKGSIVTK